MRTKYLFTVMALLLVALQGRAQSIDSLLRRAYAHNPALKALQLEYEAALNKGPQVGQLPDPTVGVGVPVLRPETRLGGQVLSIAANQMFPWPGSLKAKQDVMLTMAKSKYERVAAERLNIDFQIKTAYFNLYLLQEKQKIIHKNIRIFEAIETVALAKVESGKSIASDVLAVRLKIEALSQQLKILEEYKRGFAASINEVVNAPPDTDVQVDMAPVSLVELDYDLEHYRQVIQSNHPLIRQLDWSIEVSDGELTINALSNKPSFGVGLEYSMVAERTDAFPLHNGRDILIPRVAMSIPINRDKFLAKKDEENLKKQAYQFQKESLTNKMISNIQMYKSQLDMALLKYALATRQIEIANSAYDILLTDYSSNGRRFDELMKLQSDLNTFELERLNTLIETHLAHFKIERLTNF